MTLNEIPQFFFLGGGCRHKPPDVCTKSLRGFAAAPVFRRLSRLCIPLLSCMETLANQKFSDALRGDKIDTLT